MTKTVVLSAFQTDGTRPDGLVTHLELFGGIYGVESSIEAIEDANWQHASRAGTHVVQTAIVSEDTKYGYVTLSFTMPAAGYFTFWAARALVPTDDPTWTVSGGTIDNSDDAHPTTQAQGSVAHDWTQFWIPLGDGDAQVTWGFVAPPTDASSASKQWISRIEVYTGDDAPDGQAITDPVAADPTLDVTPASVGQGDASGGGGTSPAPKGYAKSEFVRHKGGLYIARKDGPTTEPGPGDSADWFEMVAQPAAVATSPFDVLVRATVGSDQTPFAEGEEGLWIVLNDDRSAVNDLRWQSKN